MPWWPRVPVGGFAERPNKQTRRGVGAIGTAVQVKGSTRGRKVVSSYFNLTGPITQLKLHHLVLSDTCGPFLRFLPTT